MLLFTWREQNRTPVPWGWLGEWGAEAGTGAVVRGCHVPAAGLDWFVQQKLSRLLEARIQNSLSLEHFLALRSLWFFI